ncbi:MAG: hypothetical protein K6B68_14785 [Eubacterium sp.]|nr:hypothetical protein [Eubacterium sp.]
MDDKQKQKLEELKEQMQIKKYEQSLQNNLLLQECLTAIKLYSIIENEEEIKSLDYLVSMPGAKLYSHDDIVTLEDVEEYYIVWDEASLPVIITSGKSIKENWDDVLAVAFETYFIAKTSGKVIGIRH